MVDQPAEAELSSLRKLWLAITILILVVVLNVHRITQGADITLSLKAVLGIGFPDDIPEAVAGLWGVVYLGVLILLASFVLAAHAGKARGAWSERYPFRIFDLPMHNGIGSGAQVIAIVLLSLVPLYTLGHSWKVMTEHGRLCVETADGWVSPVDGRDLWVARPDTPLRFTSSEMLIVSSTGNACGTTNDYFGPAQTWALTILAVAGIAGGLASLALLFMPKFAKKRS